MKVMCKAELELRARKKGITLSVHGKKKTKAQLVRALKLSRKQVHVCSRGRKTSRKSYRGYSPRKYLPSYFPVRAPPPASPRANPFVGNAPSLDLVSSVSANPFVGNAANTPCAPSMAHLEKYRTRPSPPYPANAPGCRGEVEMGNDGKWYHSDRRADGVYTWRLGFP